MMWKTARLARLASVASEAPRPAPCREAKPSVASRRRQRRAERASIRLPGLGSPQGALQERCQSAARFCSRPGWHAGAAGGLPSASGIGFDDRDHPSLHMAYARSRRREHSVGCAFPMRDFRCRST